MMIDTLFKHLHEAAESDDFENGPDHEVTYVEEGDTPSSFIVTMDNASEGTRDYRITVEDVTKP